MSLLGVHAWLCCTDSNFANPSIATSCNWKHAKRECFHVACYHCGGIMAGNRHRAGFRTRFYICQEGLGR